MSFYHRLSSLLKAHCLKLMIKIAVIGSGISGLAVAVRMRLRGYEVDVFEKNDYPGGKLSAFEIHCNSDESKIYRFDAGPSLFTMPQYVEELFQLAKEPIKNYFSYSKIEDVCHYFWRDGKNAIAWADKEKLTNEFSDKLGADESDILEIFSQAKNKYDISGRIFLENSLHKIKTWLKRDVLLALIQTYKLDIFSSMHTIHVNLAHKNPKLIQFLDRFATYNGSNPYKASGILSMIPHFEHGFGTYYPEGGMHIITQAIYKLGEHLGVNYYFNTEVNEIRVENKKVTGIKINNQNIHIDYNAVISNMDVYYTYSELLKDAKTAEKIKKQERSSSAIIFYWGINRAFKQLGLHNIFFSENYKEEFDALSKGEIVSDPTVYINITSKLTVTDAPPDCENWFVMINAPFDSGQNWEEIKNKLRANVISKLSNALVCNFESLIEAEQIMLPPDIESKTASYKGALYGTSSNSMTSAFMRHPNFSRKIKSLYFCGGSVHPGGGIPLCLLSAKIVDDVFLKI